MNICGIVCEYNPFHNGHLYHINKTKEQGADAVVCVMSGNFVQRGDFAIMHKRARAEAAIHGGADVVIELPLPWSISSAELFAKGAVSLLRNLGVVTHISFGAETEDVEKLKSTANALLSEEMHEKILKEYADGISFATARERALCSVSPELADIVKTPNNILAVEYLKALLGANAEISPIVIKRNAAAHDSGLICDSFASASLIREMIYSKKDISELIPASSLEIFNRESDCGYAPVFSRNADSAVMSVLKRFSPDDFKKYNDVSEGLQFRLCDAISRTASVSETVALCKTKRYAYSRLRRILLNAFLGCEAHFARGDVPYARILAFNETGRKIIKSAKKACEIPIITRPSDIKNESKKASDLFALERRADDIFSLFMSKPTAQGSTLTYSPVYVKSTD